MRVNGGCHCGAITVEAEVNPASVAVCHCTDCQTMTGSAFRVMVPAVAGTYKLSGAEPKIYVKTAESGTRRAQGFCGACGTPLFATSVGDGPKIYNVRVGTLAQRDQLRPVVQAWCRSALPWLDELATIPKIAGQIGVQPPKA